MKMKHISLNIILLLAINFQLKSQILFDAENPNLPKDSVKKIIEIKKIPIWIYSIGFDGMASSGNVNRQLINIKSSIHFANSRNIFGFFTNPRFQYGTNSSILQEREIFLDLNSTLFYLQHNLYILTFGAFEQSNLRKITTRYNVGLGIGWKIIGGNNKPESPIKLSLSNAFVKELTDYEVKQDVEIYRNSTRIKLAITLIPDKFSLNSVVFIQPSLIDNYFRWNSTSQLSYKVGKHLSIIASFENTFENFNVSGTQNTQTNTTIGLVYSGSN
jgi:putative salt-induced outer membrane protein YdiY